jgi:ribonuclease HI
MGRTFEGIVTRHQHQLNSHLRLLYYLCDAIDHNKFHEMGRINALFIKDLRGQIRDMNRDREVLLQIFKQDNVPTQAGVAKDQLPMAKIDSRKKGTEHYLSGWQKITSDQYVLDCVSGYKLEFSAVPPTGGLSVKAAFNGTLDQEKIIDEEVKTLLDKQAIGLIDEASNQFVSRLFVVPKQDESWRAVLNLKPLNLFIEKQHFKMENWWTLRSLLSQGDYMVRLDLKDAFLSIPIHKKFIKYLCFDWKGTRYAWHRLPFGLASSPRVFTKVMKPIIAHLRQRGIKLTIYMDDLLCWHKNIQKLKEQLSIIIQCLQDLGFQINFGKSDLEPSQVMDFLGFKVNLLEFNLYLTDKKQSQILTKIQDLRLQTSISGRQLASILGKLAAASQSLLAAPLYYRRLQKIQAEVIKLNGERNYANEIPMQGTVAQELDWWIQNFSSIKPAPIAFPSTVMTIFTDSSMMGWGAHANGLSIQGRWSLEQGKEHINYLELLAIKYGLMSFAKSLKQGSVQIYSDNSTAVAVMRKLGSNKSEKLNQLAAEIWEWAMEHGLLLITLHIEGKKNTDADQASRIFLDRNSWRLYPEYFKSIDARWGPHDVDLFADYSNHQVDNYVSWKPDPLSSGTDAFTLSWSKWKNIYAFPPFGLIPRVLQQVNTQKVIITLIYPIWPTQPWFPVLNEMMLEAPYLLPDHPKLLENIRNEVHPLMSSATLKLAAGRIHYR